MRGLAFFEILLHRLLSIVWSCNHIKNKQENMQTFKASVQFILGSSIILFY